MSSTDTFENLVNPIDPPLSESSGLIESPQPPSRGKRILKTTGWVLFTLFCLTFFTLIKLPDDRIKGYLDGQISKALSEKGILFSSAEGKTSFLFGLSYTMKGVTVTPLPPLTPSKIDKVVLSPSLLPLIIGRVSASFDIESQGGRLNGSFSTRKDEFSVDYNAKKFNLGSTGLVALLSGIQLDGILDGNGDLSGNMNVPSSLEGQIKLQLTKASIAPQVILGFSIPRIQISEGLIEGVIEKSKVNIKTFKLGKPGNPTDDIQGNITGDMTLAKQWNSSTLNLKARFSISENVLKSFVLLDALLGSGKQPDGSYGFNLTGPIEAPNSSPL